jgi:hypothetical protein
LKARINDIKVKIRGLLVASKSSTEKVPDWPRKEEPDDIVFENFDAYWIEGLNEWYDEEVWDTISEVEKEFEDIEKDTVLLLSI